ncbi:AbrB/MazE/SpoVT family DNA-binding domain-containing protein [Kamptonema cortianum]|nr:AbrB/MazE/SpoVT family DNA-binding domain-containing protein [Oscillatoria laete-virens]MDK3157117.1 AbrB/MazE/SpoVT family DNA-binding domain-containing protein [Kamptonema cortianum]MDL5051092.1 AbrB/MazE/SpoVT family DNA-binding domain-containing protein [Oscillatoria amoena NRMC-F 0135]MDL5055001.1 AbrB/MazE/SpoVT family DNA-binding domain-containing protein [Oscillatoria laete-virens NRMC-F 0139]
MTTTLSSKGQVVLPRLVRAKLNLSTGAKLKCEVKGDSIILKPQTPRARAHETVIDEISGLRVTKRNQGDAYVTSDMVKEILADFP